jgi:uncharacterized protein (DUF342 family)
MTKIDINFLRRALHIRRNFLNLNKDIERDEKKLTLLKDSLLLIASQLETSKNNLRKDKDSNELQIIFNKMNEVAEQSEKIQKVLDPIKDKIDSLKKDEMVLLDTIKTNYPGMELEEIKNQVQEYLNIHVK